MKWQCLLSERECALSLRSALSAALFCICIWPPDCGHIHQHLPDTEILRYSLFVLTRVFSSIYKDCHYLFNPHICIFICLWCPAHLPKCLPEFPNSQPVFLLFKKYIHMLFFFQPQRRKNFMTLLFITRSPVLPFALLFSYFFVCIYFIFFWLVLVDTFSLATRWFSITSTFLWELCVYVGWVFLPFAHCVFQLTELSRLESTVNKIP